MPNKRTEMIGACGLGHIGLPLVSILGLKIDISPDNNKFKVRGTLARRPNINKARKIVYEPKVDLKSISEKTIGRCVKLNGKKI